MTLYNKVIKNQPLRRFLVALLFVAGLVLIRKMLPLLLITFILTYLSSRTITMLEKCFKIKSPILVGIIYFICVSVLVIALIKYIPIICKQGIESYNQLIMFYKNKNIMKSDSSGNIIRYVSKLLPYLKSQSSNIVQSVKNISALIVTVFLSFILSFFFMIEKEKVIKFSLLFTKGPMAWLFQDLSFFGKKFIKTFGVVIEAQFIIAGINTLITSIVLYIMGFSHLLTLIVMIFLFSFIPIAGVVLSFIPLSLMAYSIGGLKDVMYILVTLLGVHMLETYILNPKLMASKTNLPIFYSFFILIFSEYFFHVWGLVFGIPIFIFLLDVTGIRKVELS